MKWALRGLILFVLIGGLFTTVHIHGVVMQALLTRQWPPVAQEAAFHVVTTWIFAAFVCLLIAYADKKPKETAKPSP